MNEFGIIERYFKSLTKIRPETIIGIGDDCAVVKPKNECLVAFTMDTLVSGTHFYQDASAHHIGYKALAVNLSDLAAMGAEPAYFLLSLTLPKADEAWLRSFCQGMEILLQQYPLELIGGDTTKGPLAITINAVGYVQKKQMLTRSGAQIGDGIFITGHLGDAGLAFYGKEKKIALPVEIQEQVNKKLYYPEPRIEVGFAIREFATSAIDISDGLCADLGHILSCSQVGATIFIERIPVSKDYKKLVNASSYWDLALTFGDEYELCFTASMNDLPKLNSLASQLKIPITCIGEITENKNLKILDKNGYELELAQKGYQHF